MSSAFRPQQQVWIVTLEGLLRCRRKLNVLKLVSLNLLGFFPAQNPGSLPKSKTELKMGASECRRLRGAACWEGKMEKGSRHLSEAH